MNLARSFRPAVATALLALCLVGAPAHAAAPDWSQALPPAAVGTYLDGSGLRVLVAAAGTGADPAAAAITASFRALSSVKLTMPDDSLGNLTTLDDAAIVAKAKALPVDLIAIVRVFPGNAGAENLVATLYRVDGTVASAFTAGTDAPLVAQQQATGASKSGAAASAVDDVVGGNTADFEARVKQFEERAIWMQGYAAVDARSGQIVSTWSVPMQGKYGGALKGAKFYEYVGQQEYATTYKKRQLVRGVIFGAGAAVGVAGAAYWGLNNKPYSAFEKCEDLYDEDFFPTAESDRCEAKLDKANEQATVVGLSLISAGTVAILVPFFIDPHPIKANERSRLVDEYNEKLRQELGLPKARPTSMGATLSAGGWFGPDGGGAQLAGTF